MEEMIMVELTQSLEDYLEAIWVIGLKKRVVRVKDLMKYFGYKVSSVNYALNVLSSKKLITHEKYGYIELTYKGSILAQKIYEKHKNLIKFFTQFLGIKEEIASKDACNIEHYLHEETYNNLVKFIEYIEITEANKKCLEGFRKFLKTGKIKVGKEDKLIKLSNLKKGQKGIIKKISGTPSIKQRLLNMGLTTGEIITVERIAPLGDPIDIIIKGYHLSLRKEEAELVLIEVINE